MNSQRSNTIRAGKTLVGLTLAAALAATGFGCSSSPGNSPTGTAGTGGSASGGKGGSTAGTGGTAGSTAGTGGTANGGSTGATAGTGGTASGGTTGGSTAGTGGTAAGGTTGGSTAGTGGTAAAGTGGSTAGTSGSTGSGGTGGGSDWLKLPAIPPTLNVPAGANVKLHFHATGDQVYTCTASSPGGAGGGAAGGAGGGSGTTYSYVLNRPDAKLYDQNNVQVGTHGTGPNWTSTVDNSVVNGAKVWGENSTGTIQWLLLRATGHTGAGVMDDVTYVIRANTTGGVAPSTGCDSTTVGTEARSPYTADYYMFNGGGPTAWATVPSVATAIAVPNGATYAQHYHAIGAQVYTCTASSTGGAGGGAGGAGGTSGTTYTWVLKQPDAALYDSAFTQIGTHGLGPNWTSTVDGSVVVGAKVSQAAGMTGAVPLLLLMATSNTGTGVFSNITYVQRLNTAGGPAPASCDATNTTDLRVPYSADYYFFTGGTTNNDGGTNG